MNGEALGTLITKSLMIITATITINSAEARNINLFKDVLNQEQLQRL